MASKYLSKLTGAEREALKQRLHLIQSGKCFICDAAISLELQSSTLDIDHVIPLNVDGVDDETNLALTHGSCNRSKQASDLRVARCLARFERLKVRCHAEDGRSPSLADVLADHGGATHDLALLRQGDKIKYSFAAIGDTALHEVPVYQDKLSGVESFFAEIPIAYLHHDAKINPRPIGGSLRGLMEEFFKRRPQLHVALAWTDLDGAAGNGRLHVFDGQHKASAQVLLGTRKLPVRIFLNPDINVLLTTNANAGDKLRQVAFDKSVKRRLGSSLYADRVSRYQLDHHFDEQNLSFSEADLVNYFKGEAREVRRYIVDAVRDGVTQHADNKLRDYIDLGGRAQERPLSYSTVEKTFYSFFICPDLLHTPLDYELPSGDAPRELERDQIVRLMNIIAEEIFIGQFDPEIGTYRIENKLQGGDAIPEPHLRAFRMAKEEIIYNWLGYIRKIAEFYFNMQGEPIDEAKLFQEPFPETLWDRITAFVRNLKLLPLWVNKDLSLTVFGGKQPYGFWQQIFRTGETSSGQHVMVGGINYMKMISEKAGT